jgi:hypothetical protein
VQGNKKNIMNNILQIEDPASDLYTLCIANFETGKQFNKKTKDR